MKRLIAVCSVLILIGCASTKSVSSERKNSPKNTDERYGYGEINPIKVGGVSKGEGPQQERDYLYSLSGPKGEELSFYRIGSCCPFDSENSPFGGGMLDMYSVTYEGKGDTVVLYINMYDEDVLYAPDGFKFKM